MDLHRREFLKVLGVAGASAVFDPRQRFYDGRVSPIDSPKDIPPGEDVFYATTCRECPAGCGMHIKNRDGRAIKAEGNPANPISFGNLCPRGQASLQGLYNPDRFPGPMKKNAGKYQPITWEAAERQLLDSLAELHQKGRGTRIAMITDLQTGALRDLMIDFMSLFDGGENLLYEPFAYEALRSANEIVFRGSAIPNYRIDMADFLISFNAGFLETWISNVEYAHYFSLFHEPDLNRDSSNVFVYVGPRNSLTAANADKWIRVKAGDEYLVALGMLRAILDESPPSLPPVLRAQLESSLAGFSMENIAGSTGVDAQTIRKLARLFAGARRPLALAEGQSFGSPNALEAAVASNLLCSLFPGTQELIDFQSRSALSLTARPSEMKDLSERMGKGGIDLLLIYRANPAFSLPPSWKFTENLAKIPMVVSFSSWQDETTAHAQLVLPSHTPLESWGDYSPRINVNELIQPTMGQVFGTRSLGDILLSIAKRYDKAGAFQQQDFHQLLRNSWRGIWQISGSDKPFETFWLESVQAGGFWEATSTERTARDSSSWFSNGFSFRRPEPISPSRSKELPLIAYPTIQFFDGRTANRPWLQELPDPITQVTWGGWAEIHPDTAGSLGVDKGDVLRLKSEYGEIEVPALPIYSVPQDLIAVPIGQGHTDFGRYATGLPANPVGLLPDTIDERTGGILGRPVTVKVDKTGKQFAIANTDGNYYQLDRKLIQTSSFQDYKKKVSSSEKPEIDEPLPTGYNLKKDFYPPRYPIGYRWCMVLDLDRCIGCGACSVACYAENNLAVVGREQVLKQREMSWLTVQRYFYREESLDKIEWLVMLCQHCTEAPCESVCPVFAPQHSIEGLNAQIYNRCIGTRDCSQNDPWKVRRFNFEWYKHPFPLDMQLNPDVTVRQVGVMEKCSFCVQRIIRAKAAARNEGRKVRDGEFTTACAQTCPTNALIFGSLLDPESMVSRLIKDPRAYQTLKELNTKPAAIYLKRIVREV